MMITSVGKKNYNTRTTKIMKMEILLLGYRRTMSTRHTAKRRNTRLQFTRRVKKNSRVIDDVKQ